MYNLKIAMAMENEEKSRPELVDKDILIRGSLIDNNVEEDARGFISKKEGGPCGNWGAKFINLKNSHQYRQISATIQVKWIYENRQYAENNVYTLYPGQEIGLGCPIPGPTSQRFDYSIIAAWFS